ncbi:ubiquitin carboxy-terminal hydrolase [Vairimorpha apis BRL 01]|uniref:Ubiquitin carboxy-terminal hydrolase n=1 Tax=Vairimorpha apis BRL 01 TaxID=1037528 RepID=T0L471_9MICR|nr:ubiquitin carboxy-terminal hydrolase [Vairimorpha apis BRL 01]
MNYETSSVDTMEFVVNNIWDGDINRHQDIHEFSKIFFDVIEKEAVLCGDGEGCVDDEIEGMDNSECVNKRDLCVYDSECVDDSGNMYCSVNRGDSDNLNKNNSNINNSNKNNSNSNNLNKNNHNSNNQSIHTSTHTTNKYHITNTIPY